MAMPISLGHKLHTNNPLTIEEADAIGRAFIISSDKSRAIEEKIAHLQNRFNILSLRKQQQLDFVEGHRKLLSPARRLLPEILQEVFYHCLPPAHNATMSTEEAPLLLGRVCRRWRQIAYSTPWLWNSIHIVAPWSSSFDEERRHAISAWLSRSGMLPLAISMIFVGLFMQPTGSLVHDWVKPYLELILPYAHRWKRIHLDLSYFDWISFFEVFEAPAFPMLKTLYVGSLPLISEDGAPGIIALPRKGSILQAPKLRNLSLPGYLPRLIDLPLQWEALNGLDFSAGISPESLNKTLALCPNLEVCSLSITPPGPAEGWQSHKIVRVTLPKLLTLVVKNTNTRNEYISQLFESLSVPALRHLTYERTIFIRSQSPTGDFEPPGLSNSLLSFLRRLVYPLEELDLYISSEKILNDVLSLVPGLKRLVLRGSCLPNSWRESTTFLRNYPLMLLTQGNGHNSGDLSSPVVDHSGDDGNYDGVAAPSCCCPNLQILQCHAALFSSDEIIEFLCARSVNRQKYNAAPLRRVHISFLERAWWERYEDEEIESTRNVILELGQKTGMAVYLEYPTAPKPVKAAASSLYSPFHGLTHSSPSDLGGPTFLEF